MPIKDLPLDAQPREKLAQRGAAALSDAELLAVILRTGMAGKTVLQMAQELLELPGDRQGAGGLAGLLAADYQALAAVKGLGPAKRAELMAVLELARRATAQQLREREVFSSPEAVKHYLQLHLAARPHEVFAVLFLDSQNRLLALEEMFRGTLTQTSVYPREVVLRALHHQAGAVILKGYVVNTYVAFYVNLCLSWKNVIFKAFARCKKSVASDQPRGVLAEKYPLICGIVTAQLLEGSSKPGRSRRVG